MPDPRFDWTDLFWALIGFALVMAVYVIVLRAAS